MHRLAHIISTSLLLLVCSCTAEAPINNAGDDGKSDSENTHWGYMGETGPTHWAELDEDYKACDVNRPEQRQSPIDIPSGQTHQCGEAATGSGITDLVYNSVPTTMVDNGHTLQVNLPTADRADLPLPSSSENYMVADNTVYNLIQYHVHTPSEHVVDGKEYPLELHLVHKAQDGTLAVLGLFAETNETSESCAAEVATRTALDFPEGLGPTPEDAQAINPMELIGDQIPSVYAYSGSLTTPPCSEIVSWYVATKSICISLDQLKRIEASIDAHSSHGDEHAGEAVDSANARRPIATLNERAVRLCGGK